MLAAGACGLGAAAAAAFTGVSPPFTSAAPLVWNAPMCNLGFGQLSLVGGLSDASHLYFTDFCNDTTYRFGLDGGSIEDAELAVANGLDSALAVSNGTYFGIAQEPSSIAAGLYAFDPDTLAIGNLLVSESEFGGTNPKGLAADPQTTALYVSSNSGIYRVRDPLGTPRVKALTQGNFDGLAFNNRGSILYAASNDGPNAGHVYGFNRKGVQIFDVPVGDGPDGIAVAPPHRTVNGEVVSNNLFVNTNSGTLLRIDVNNGNAVSTVASGGSRGDFTFVDFRGYLNVSQSDGYVRLRPHFFRSG